MPRVLPGVPLPTASADALEPDDDESPVPSAEALDALYEFNLEEEDPPVQPLAHQRPRAPSPTPTEPMYEPAEPGPFGVKKSLPLPPWVDDDYPLAYTVSPQRSSRLVATSHAALPLSFRTQEFQRVSMSFLAWLSSFIFLALFINVAFLDRANVP